MKKKYKKKPIKGIDKEQVSESEEHPDSTLNQSTMADFSDDISEGGDYVDHTAEEVDPVQRDILQQSAPVGYIGSDDIGSVDVDWNQMAIDKRKKRLYGGRTREGIKRSYNFVKDLLFGKYICLNCHKLFNYKTERCPNCNSYTTAFFNSKPIKKDYSILESIEDDYARRQQKKYIDNVEYFDTECRGLKYIHVMAEGKSLQELKEVPGTRLKSSGRGLPGKDAYAKEIDALRKPFAAWLNDRQGGSGQTIFKYVEKKPENYTIYDKTYTVVTTYLERLKLIRLQLWYELYHSLGGLGDFKDIKKVTIDKQDYIKLYIPESEGFYPYTAKHPASDKTILILSPTPDPELDAVEDIQPVKIGRSETVPARMNLSKKHILYEPFKEAIHALIFNKDELIIVIPQEKSFIFPLEPDDFYKWSGYESIISGATLSERNPSGPTNMYIEWDADDFYDEL